MTDDAFMSFGDRQAFAIEARLIADPDAHSGSNNDAWSFGEFRLYVRSRCLTRHTIPGGMRDEIRWYLAPLIRWLSRAWLPLFHEQRFPSAVGLHEHPIVRFEQGERLLLDDSSAEGSARRKDMQAWRKRHALWTAAAGGVLPNIWFRRQSDLCEISYDPGTTIGAPRPFEFQSSRGTALIDIEIVAKAFLEFLQWGIHLGRAAGQTIGAPDETDVIVQEAGQWLIGDHLSGLLTEADAETYRISSGIIYPLSPEVAMFGTLTPNLSGEDAFVLLDALRRARSTNPEAPNLLSMVTAMAPATQETSWEQGYELALQAIDTLEPKRDRSEPIDVEHVLHGLGVHVEDLDIRDVSLRGVAIAGEGFRPTVIVNSSANWNRSRPGRRFTLAHELAHLLVDRGRARRVTHSSTPWAPEAVERRANAFAAMFLMPYEVVDTALADVGRVIDKTSLRKVAGRLRCGRVAVLEHLKNIDRVDASVYFQIKADLARI